MTGKWRCRSLALAAVLPMTAALAQSNAPQPTPGQEAQPRELTVAPNAPRKTPEPEAQAGGQVQSTGAPANICEELVAYLKQPKPVSPGNAASPPQAPNAASAAQPVSPGQTAPAVDRPQQSSGQSAPIAGNDHQDAAAPQVGLDRAQALLNGNDLKGCQKAAREMRRAGAALPAGLLALAALREELLVKSRAPAGQ
jgi:hypothetical protein